MPVSCSWLYFVPQWAANHREKNPPPMIDVFVQLLKQINNARVTDNRKRQSSECMFLFARSKWQAEYKKESHLGVNESKTSRMNIYNTSRLSNKTTWFHSSLSSIPPARARFPTDAFDFDAPHIHSPHQPSGTCRTKQAARERNIQNHNPKKKSFCLTKFSPKWSLHMNITYVNIRTVTKLKQ